MSYEAIYKCGFCRKETPVTDEKFREMVSSENFKGVCKCGHNFTYNSSIRAKVLVDKETWKSWRRGSGS